MSPNPNIKLAVYQDGDDSSVHPTEEYGVVLKIPKYLHFRKILGQDGEEDLDQGA
jgi:hypothetical protein